MNFCRLMLIHFISFLGEWKVNDVKPAVTGEAQEVKVKVRINQNGILLISSAQMLEKKDAAEEQNGANEAEPQSPTETSPAQDGQAPASDPMETQDVSQTSHLFRFFVQQLSV